MIEGLKALQNRRDSKITYSVHEEVEYGRLCIDTNIPVEDGQTVSIDVESNGDICATGWDSGEGQVEYLATTENGDADPILKAVTKKAALAGLIK